MNNKQTLYKLNRKANKTISKLGRNYSALNEYNEIVNDLGLEHLAVDRKSKFGTSKWNLRDMVSEIDYQYSTYKENGHFNNDCLHSSDRNERLHAMRECKRLKRFISKYSADTSKLKCYENHCSRFDNAK